MAMLGAVLETTQPKDRHDGTSLNMTLSTKYFTDLLSFASPGRAIERDIHRFLYVDTPIIVSKRFTTTSVSKGRINHPFPLKNLPFLFPPLPRLSSVFLFLVVDGDNAAWFPQNM